LCYTVVVELNMAIIIKSIYCPGPNAVQHGDMFLGLEHILSSPILSPASSVLSPAAAQPNAPFRKRLHNHQGTNNKPSIERNSTCCSRYRHTRRYAA
jgi:hypothetical protein